MLIDIHKNICYDTFQGTMWVNEKLYVLETSSLSCINAKNVK